MTAYRILHHISDTLTLETPDGVIECPALYEVTAVWWGREMETCGPAQLIRWWFKERMQTVHTAAQLLGHDEISRQEQLVQERWLETAADERADDMAADRADAMEDA